MAGSFLRRPLSGSTDGRGIKVAATGTPGTTIHTAQASATLVDVITLYAYNSNTTPENLTIEFGGSTAPDDNIVITIPPSGTAGAMVGAVPVVVDLVLRNSLVVKAFSTTTNKVVIFGFVNTES